MKILAVSEDTPVLAGGRLSFFKICRALSIENDVKVLSCSGKTETILGRSRIEERIDMSILPPIQQYIIFLVWALKKIIDSIRSYHILFVNAGIMVFPSMLIGKIMNRRVIVLQHDSFTIHDVLHICNSAAEKITACISWCLSYPPLLFVDLVFCVSDFTVTKIRARRKYVLGNIVGGL